MANTLFRYPVKDLFESASTGGIAFKEDFNLKFDFGGESWTPAVEDVFGARPDEMPEDFLTFRSTSALPSTIKIFLELVPEIRLVSGIKRLLLWSIWTFFSWGSSVGWTFFVDSLSNTRALFTLIFCWVSSDFNLICRKILIRRVSSSAWSDVSEVTSTILIGWIEEIMDVIVDSAGVVVEIVEVSVCVVSWRVLCRRWLIKWSWIPAAFGLFDAYIRCLLWFQLTLFFVSELTSRGGSDAGISWVVDVRLFSSLIGPVLNVGGSLGGRGLLAKVLSTPWSNFLWYRGELVELKRRSGRAAKIFNLVRLVKDGRAKERCGCCTTRSWT